MDSKNVCPVCKGSGDDPIGCSCQSFTEDQEENCERLKCEFCMCSGCGGSCLYCGGTGLKKDWQLGGPYPQDYETDEEMG